MKSEDKELLTYSKEDIEALIHKAEHQAVADSWSENILTLWHEVTEELKERDIYQYDEYGMCTEIYEEAAVKLWNKKLRGWNYGV